MSANGWDRLLDAKDPWSVITELESEWSESLARDCAHRYESLGEQGRKRVLWLLDRVRTADAHAILLERLPLAREDEAAQILRALNSAGVVVSSEEIVRLLDQATLEAVVAAGISGDATLSPLVAMKLGEPNIERHAALALASLGAKEHTAAIVARLEKARGLDASGLVVALEVMNDASIVPELQRLLVKSAGDLAWDLHHAIWRLTGREPLVRLAKDRDDASVAFADAWRGFDASAQAHPAIVDVQIESPTARFDLRDGRGLVRIDYDPPSPGSSWPRWSKSLFVGTERLFAIGSDCGTCETTLLLTGSCPTAAAEQSSNIRGALANATVVDEELLRRLQPYWARLRTGHYLARLIDLDLEHVARPEDSWLTRRYERRGGEIDLQWPGLAHYQVREPGWGAFPTHGILLPQSTAFDESTIEQWQGAIESGDRPAALAMCWVEQKDVEAEFTERFLVGMVLDGHHKLAAYQRAGKPAHVLAISRLEDSWGPREDPSLWLREAFSSLEA